MDIFVKNIGLGEFMKKKNIYRKIREDLHISREGVARKIVSIEDGKYSSLDYNRLVKIEDDSVRIFPDDVVALSKVYCKPELRNYYCCNECEIGKIDTPEITFKDNIHEILVNMVVSLEAVNNKKSRLMEILADGKIDCSEVEDFNQIQKELEKISITIEAISLWCEKMKNKNNE